MAIKRPDIYEHNNPDLAFVDSTFVRGGTRAVANLTALYALSSKVDQLAERITRVWVASEAKYYVLTNIASVGSAGGWTAESTASTLQQVTDNGATTTNTITAAGFTTAGNLTAGGIVSTSQFYASATNYANSIFVGWDAGAVYLGYQMGNLMVDIGTGVTNKVRIRNTGGFQIESLAGSGDRMMVVDANGNVSVQSIPTGSVTSVFGRTGSVTAQSGDYTTAQVTESGNLYYTDARARAALSAGTGISYNSTTGVISYSGTVYTDSSIRGLFSAGAGISYNSTTGAISSTITQYTDANARAALSFAAGSGAYNSTTGVITIPTNNNQLTNGAGYITGNQTITISGDASGSGTTAITVTLANSGVSAGTYTKVTVDAKGRVTSGTSLSSGDVTGALGYTPPQPNGTGATAGSTWAINITGNAASASNSTGWNGEQLDYSSIYNTAPDYIIGYAAARTRPFSASAIQSFLGLGSYAYRSSGLAELSGGNNFTGTQTITQSTAGAEGLRVDGSSGGFAFVVRAGSDRTAHIRSGLTIGESYFTTPPTNGLIVQGNVGIGTTSPAGIWSGAHRVLQVASGANTSSEVVQSRAAGVVGAASYTNFLSGTTNLFGVYTADALDYLIHTNGIERLRIASTGAATFSSLSGSGNRIVFANSSGTLGSMVIGSGLSFDGTTLTATGGSSGSIAGSGTSGIIPVFTGASSIGNSVLSQTSGNLSATGTFTATSLIRSGGTSSQFLKADGSVDSNSYLTTAVTSATGTSNQIAVSASTGAVTFSLTTNVTISGNFTGAGFFESSDARKKTIIERYASSGVDTCKYIFNETGLDHYGYIAQEVEKVLPNAVTTREDGMKDVKYSEVHTFKIMLLENEIKTLKDKIKQLEGGI